MDALRMVIAVIGATVILCVLGIVYLVLNDKGIPSTLETITAAGVTGLLGLLVRGPQAP